MKRVGCLFDQIVDRENLLAAYAAASRGKSLCRDRLRFAENLETNLATLAQGLIDGTFPVGNYKRFLIHDPKEREICAASFPERVLHHALMNVCGPYFDKWLIFDSYASQKGKGQLRAVRRAQQFARRYKWFMKCDIRKYFDSIPHGLLLRQLHRKFKDPMVLLWFEKLILTYEKTPGRGLPIGNLTSQYFANLYLDGVDRQVSPYVRYMDDFIFWADEKEILIETRGRVEAFLKDVLSLELKREPIVNRTTAGMDFLGFRVFPERVGLARNSVKRYFRRTRAIMKSGMDETVAQVRLTSMTAFVRQADTLSLRKERFGKI